jgi:hypothetical protein
MQVTCVVTITAAATVSCQLCPRVAGSVLMPGAHTVTGTGSFIQMQSLPSLAHMSVEVRLLLGGPTACVRH